jgi:hypothetical protein
MLGYQWKVFSISIVDTNEMQKKQGCPDYTYPKYLASFLPLRFPKSLSLQKPFKTQVQSYRNQNPR